MAGGWQILQAPNRGEPSGRNEMREMSQEQKLTQPGFYDKEQYKEEHADDKMLPGQQLYYDQKEGYLNQREQALRGTMMSYFSKSSNIPSSAMQTQWNTELSNISQQRMLLKAEGGEFKSNYKIADARRTKLIEGRDKSTANRLAMRNVNGTYLATLGPKETGDQGWLTQLEEVKGFDYAPGTKGGAPVDTDLSTSINYTGDFNEFVDKAYSKVSSSKTLRPQIVGKDKDGKPIYADQSVSPLYDSGNSSFVSVLTQHDNAGKVLDAAGNMIEDMRGTTAELDLATKFHEKLLRIGHTADGNLGISLDNNIHQLNFDKDESGTLRKYLSGQKLDRQDIDRIGDMTKKYGQALILSKAPSKIETEDALKELKVVDKGTGEGVAPPQGEFTLLSKGELQPSGNSQIVRKQHNALSYGTEPLLNEWTISPRGVQDFNKDANEMKKTQGGIDPTYFSSGPMSKGFNVFFSEDGYPNDMAILKDSGAAIVGITGRVHENLKPVPVKGKTGYGLDVPDVSNMTNYELENNKVMTVEVVMAVPEGSPFFDQLTVADGMNKKTGVSEGDFTPQNYYFLDSAAKKQGKTHRLVHVWVPVDRGDLTKFENKGYEKGTSKAQVEQAQQVVADKVNQLQYLGEKTKIN